MPWRGEMSFGQFCMRLCLASSGSAGSAIAHGEVGVASPGVGLGVPLSGDVMTMTPSGYLDEALFGVVCGVFFGAAQRYEWFSLGLAGEWCVVLYGFRPVSL